MGLRLAVAALAVAYAVAWVALVPLGPVILTLSPSHGIHVGDALAFVPLALTLIRRPGRIEA